MTMNWLTANRLTAHRTQTRRLMALLLMTGIVLGSMPIATAQTYTPPNRGLPGRRQGGGTRGSCISQLPTLTALMPDSNLGLTTQEFPTWLWYVPANTAMAAEFVLLNGDETEVYSTTFQVSGDAGFIRLSLPTDLSLPPLTIGEDYHWYFALICDRADRSGDVLTEGWVQRIAPEASLLSALEAAPASDRPRLYAEAGIWQDALSVLAELYAAQPSDPDLANQWRTLLDSVALGELADYPFQIRTLDAASANAPATEN